MSIDFAPGKLASAPAVTNAAPPVVKPRAQEEKSERAQLTARLNWLRAAVLGANDGIVSVAGLVIGVAAYDPSNTTAILLAAAAGLLAGAFSMAAGEYVSVSSQRDSEAAIVAAERAELEADPEGQLKELADMYVERGVAPDTAMQVAKELTAKDALAAHLALEAGIDQESLVNPWSAAFSSAISFTLGAALPIAAVWLAPATWVRVPVTFVSVMVALALTGWVSAHLGEAHKGRAMVRLLAGGLLAMAATWGIGALLGVSV
ncbi:MAG: VIT family protein [Buchananella hordeovulneris]|nr:VIT family protein [Buchananella hordeovulneris]